MNVYPAPTPSAVNTEEHHSTRTPSAADAAKLGAVRSAWITHLNKRVCATHTFEPFHSAIFKYAQKQREEYHEPPCGHHTVSVTINVLPFLYPPSNLFPFLFLLSCSQKPQHVHRYTFRHTNACGEEHRASAQRSTYRESSLHHQGRVLSTSLGSQAAEAGPLRIGALNLRW